MPQSLHSITTVLSLLAVLACDRSGPRPTAREGEGVSASHGAKVTVVLRSRARIAGHVIELRDGVFSIGADGKRMEINLREVFVLDFESEADRLEVSEVLGVPEWGHLVVLRDGRRIEGHLHGVEMGEDQQTVVSVAVASNLHNLNADEIARIYLRAYEGRLSIEEDPPETRHLRAPPPGTIIGTIYVPGNVAWVETEVQIQKSEALVFDPSGTVALSNRPNDFAGPPGAADLRLAGQGAPGPGLPLGALLGRVGEIGPPFVIGYGRQPITMPAGGPLWLGINDDTPGDNTGGYTVTIGRP